LKMSKVENRENKLLELLQTYRRLDIKQVSDWLEISDTTARRMCSRLERKNKVIRVHGGVQLSSEYSYINKEMEYLQEKVAIGNYCASMIESGERIFCDSGTTVHQFVLALINRIKNNEIRDIVILSNSLTNFDPIAKYCKVILIGGEVRIDRMDVCGSIAEEILKKFHISRAFLGVDAIHETKGLMTTDERTAGMNKIILNDADAVSVLADSSKFNQNSFLSYTDSSENFDIVTDWNISETVLNDYRQKGYSLIVVNQILSK